MPYRTAENVIAGAVMTFVDVHNVKQADKIRRLAIVWRIPMMPSWYWIWRVIF